MNLKQPYSRDNYIRFLRDSFLTDTLKISAEKLKPEISTKYIKDVYRLGKDADLDLSIFEIRHDSEYDPRVSLSKETFRLMSQYGMRKALAVYTSPRSENYRLSFITIDISLDGAKVKRTYSNPRRYSYFLGPEAKTRTPEQFLIKKGRVKDHDDLQSRFSVEVVNKEFYKSIAEKFTELVGGQRKIKSKIEKFRRKLKLPSVDENSAQVYQEFTVRLIGRLVFCWFLKMKKSDAGIPLISDDVLSLEAAKNTSGYYQNVIEKLFFEVLNTPFDERRAVFKKEPFKSIPFLNGGLFNPHDKDYYKTDGLGVSKYLNTLSVPDTWLREFIEILETYNFTVDENTSVDIDLSVDPEMLGRIFANLLAEINPETGESARKATGSFYTPRPIVEYMVDESLKQYLTTKTNIDEEKIIKLLSYDSWGDEDHIELSEREKQIIVDALDKLKILDPASGSGAFPIGILNKMLVILQKVDQDSKMWLDRQLGKIEVPALRTEVKRKLESENVDYIHKLGIIQNSIYGVDIQPIAVELSKLRCFLSLIVDAKVKDDEDNRGIQPLPNLEFKFVAANTLIGLPGKPQQGELLNVDEEIAKLEELRRLYFTAFGEDKKNIEREFKKTQKELVKNYFKKKAKDERAVKIANWNPFSDDASDWFDPEWMFGLPVHSGDGGFDIVIGNPPYMQLQKNSGKLSKLYKHKGYETFETTGDIYVLFYELGFKILKPKGILTYITSNQWMRVNYGKSLRKFLSKLNPLILVNLGPKVFHSATVDTNIFIGEKANNDNQLKGLILKNINEIEKLQKNDFHDMHDLDDSAWFISDYITQKIRKTINNKGTPLKEWKLNIYRGVLTGLNDAFVIDDIKRDQLVNQDRYSEEIIKPLLRGRDIQRYVAEWNGGYVISTFPSLKLNIDKYKAVKEYLEGFLPILKQTGEIFKNNEGNKVRTRKKTNNKWFETQDQIGFVNEFKKEKIIWKRIGSIIRFAYSDKEIYCLDSTCIATGEKIKYLTAYLNSKLGIYQLLNSAPKTGMGDVIISVQALEPLPVYHPNQIEEEYFKRLVDYILFMKSRKLTDVKEKLIPVYFEQIIDGMIYDLYFNEILKQHDREIIKHLEQLPTINDNINSSQNLDIVKSVFDRFNDNNHPIRNNLFYLDSIPEIRMIEGKNENNRY